MPLHNVLDEKNYAAIATLPYYSNKVRGEGGNGNGRRSCITWLVFPWCMIGWMRETIRGIEPIFPSAFSPLMGMQCRTMRLSARSRVVCLFLSSPNIALAPPNLKGNWVAASFTQELRLIFTRYDTTPVLQSVNFTLPTTPIIIFLSIDFL